MMARNIPNPKDNERVGTFQEKAVPAETRLAGWTWLVQKFGVQAPVRHPGVVSDQYVKASFREEGDWTIYDKRYWPGDDFGDHLGFALRNENLDLLVLKRLYEAVPRDSITAYVRSAPTGAHNRRAWFLYEFLIGRTLDIENAAEAGFTDLLDGRRYFTGPVNLSRRHKVRDNLLGNRDFCPVIRKTKTLTDYGARSLGEKANQIIGHTGANVIARAASFLLLADSRASFEIEGERPPRSRLERWGRAVVQAGKNKLTLDEILRLHTVLIADTRFTQLGLRLDGVFLGERDHEGDPLPEFIGA